MTEVKKELTKDLLALSFKELIMKMPFEKITVKMITDGADVIRPTFYKHFQDKYEIIEYILKKEIKDKIRVLIENDMEDDLLRLLFTCLSKQISIEITCEAPDTQSRDNCAILYLWARRFCKICDHA